MRTKIDDPMPGDIIDGQRCGIPEYWKIDHVRDLECFAPDTYVSDLMRLDDSWRRKHGGRRTPRAVMGRLTSVLRRFAEATNETVYVHAGGIGDRPTGYEQGAIRLTIWAGHYDFVLTCHAATLSVSALIGEPKSVVHHRVYTVAKLVRSLEQDYQLRRSAQISARREKSMRHAICPEIVAILGESEFGAGYVVHDDAVETTHEFARRYPTWQNSMEQHFRVSSVTLGLNSCLSKLERIAGNN